MTPVRKPWLHLFWALPSILVFLVVVFYLISNLQGRAVWESVLQELAAKGETIDVDELLGPEPPTESNVARHPFWTSKEAQELTRAAEANSALLKSLPLLPTLKPLDVTSAMKLVGLESSGNEANDIRQLRAFFETMRSPWYVPLQEAISRSEAVWLTNRNFPINSPLISQPLFESSKMLAMLCLFALLDGDQEQAMEGLHSLDRLVDVITVPGSALHHLIASVTLKYMLGTIAYGLEFGMWRTSDLLALDSVLAKKQIRNWMRIVLQSERAILLTSVMYSPSRTFAGGSRSASLEGWLGSILQTMRPSGWDFEDRAFSAMNTQQMIDVLNNDSVLDWSSKIKESEIELEWLAESSSLSNKFRSWRQPQKYRPWFGNVRNANPPHPCRDCSGTGEATKWGISFDH